MKLGSFSPKTKSPFSTKKKLNLEVKLSGNTKPISAKARIVCYNQNQVNSQTGGVMCSRMASPSSKHTLKMIEDLLKREGVLINTLAPKKDVDGIYKLSQYLFMPRRRKIDYFSLL